ncbi:TPA: hypothetical protein ACVPFL_002437 [Morganella morganii]
MSASDDPYPESGYFLMLLKGMIMVLKMFMNCEICHQKGSWQSQKKAVNHKLILSAPEEKTVFRLISPGIYCGYVGMG